MRAACGRHSMLTDTHAHLDFSDFAGEVPDLIARAAAAGIHRIVTIGTSVEGSARAAALAGEHASVYAAIGIHPDSAESAPEGAINTLREMARLPRVAAIGEIGLDYHRLPGAALRSDPERAVEADALDGACKAVQARLFEEQLGLAVELGLNAVIHQRDAWDDTLAIVEKYTGKLRLVFHCFGEAPARARRLFDLGHLVSFTGIVTFKNAKSVHETAVSAPDGSFMVETDCPFLAPAPHRGSRCEPAHTRLVAERLAVLRGCDLGQIAESTEQTAGQFFRFGAR